MSTIQKRLHSLKDQPEEGFTLIELLVVLLIIGILLAIAIPTFLSTAKTANSTAAQANLQTALTGANAYWTEEGQTYSGIDSAGNPTVSNISDIDTGVNYVSGTNSSGLNVVSLWTDGSTSLVMSAYAPGTHDCWSIVDLKAPSSTVWGGLGMGTYYALDAGVPAGDCVATGTLPTTGTVTGPQQGGFPSA
ncbi:MAG: prepilin-type N-terminal cleavage/methylation domain-containing protein [Acidimicrobiales bacterium]|jgi:type IV pilus assembly protein PilA